ncbi:double-stranded RNA binding motif domain-containing protein [Pedococcus bigeumensis]|uniref:double-stranded RNA binding motif domain-containing protein n=1 Tax=Pedococcus bigeumensis TaxID=433644 RepID=UPI002FEAD13C
MLKELTRLDLAPDAAGVEWLRWASMHSSYLYESMPDSPLNARVLDVLATLGRGWLRLVLLDEIRSTVGEFTSSAEVSAALQQEQLARVAVEDWVVGLGAAFLGRGERAMQAAGQRSNAAELVGLQIVGALSLLTASRTPAASILRAAGFRPSAPEPDWRQLIVSTLKQEPTVHRSESGPDHDRLFTVSVEAKGLTASATERSVRSARSAAYRTFVQRNLPHAVPRPSQPVPVRRSQAYDARLPRHDRARDWVLEAFEMNDSGLVSQALTHASWVHENPSLVTRAHQRDFAVLATEGAEVLTTLVRHQHALNTLNATFDPPSGAVTAPHVTRDDLARLLDALPLGAGVLRSKGLATLTADVKENVVQAVAGAAWRANGDLIFHRQEQSVARWVRDFSPPADSVTQLQNYCARAKARFQVTFEERGPQHERYYRARITFLVPMEPSWRGGWMPGKTAAKQDAARGLVALLLDERPDPTAATTEPEADRIVGALFVAELDALASGRIGNQRALAGGHLGVDLLAVGDYEQFTAWTARRSSMVREDQASLMGRLGGFYESVLMTRRREAVRTWISRNMPSRTNGSVDAVQRISQWSVSDRLGRLALLADVLDAVEGGLGADAILDCVERQATAIAASASGELESSRTNEASGRTITIRVRGAEISDAFVPVIEAVDAVVGLVRWSRRPQGLIVTVPEMPEPRDPVVRTGLMAVASALGDPWLDECRAALNGFLARTEGVLGGEGRLDDQAAAEFSAAEAKLVEALRIGAERPESDADPISASPTARLSHTKSGGSHDPS